jgi:hypothetical protein
MHRHFLEALLSIPAHIICTMRAKTKYESRKDDRGRMKFEKVGEGPIQREGIEYEGDRLDPGSIWPKLGADVAALLAEWIEDAEPAPAPTKPVATEAPAKLADIVTDLAAKVDLTQTAIDLAVSGLNAILDARGTVPEKRKGAIAGFHKLLKARLDATAEQRAATT